MIKPINRASNYLEFECDQCRLTFHHAIKLYHDAPAENEAKAYDVRSWIIAGIEVQCPKCHALENFKLALRPDLKTAVM